MTVLCTWAMRVYHALGWLPHARTRTQRRCLLPHVFAPVCRVNGEAVLYVQDKNSPDSSPGRRCMAYTPVGRKQSEIAMPLTGNWYYAAYSSGACRYTIQSCTGDCDF